MINTRLKIWINKKPVLQGKYYELNGKPTFLFNVDQNKVLRKYNAYGIADQILDKLPHGTQIIAKNIDTHVNYVTNRSRVQKKGIKEFLSGHTQWFLPLKNWEVFKDSLEEPYELPAQTISEWIGKPEPKNVGIAVSVFDQIRQRNPGLVASLKS